MLKVKFTALSLGRTRILKRAPWGGLPQVCNGSQKGTFRKRVQRAANGRGFRTGSQAVMRCGG